jgi:hypothetical protein
MKDLFNAPYHEELHEILTGKGFKRKRMIKQIDIEYDAYTFGEMLVLFFEDDTINILDANGNEVSEEEFDEITDGIFSEKENGKGR